MFGVVVELGTSRISDPTAFAVTIFAGLIWPPSSGLCMAAWRSTSPPKALCQCIELRFSFAVELVGTCWAGLTNIA